MKQEVQQRGRRANHEENEYNRYAKTGYAQETNPNLTRERKNERKERKKKQKKRSSCEY